MSKECEKCFYYGVVGDAPEGTEPECMWQPSEDDGYKLPCEQEDENGADN